MTDPFIDLQRRADEAATLLRNCGHRAEADLILELRRAAYERQDRLNTIHRALAGAIRKESER